MKEISDGSAGNLASEINLVLASLRVAKAENPWEEMPTWQVWGRPHPAFVSRLRDELVEVRKGFESFIPSSAGGRLKELLESIRLRLVYDKS